MTREGLLQIALAEIHAGLAQHLAVQPQHHGFSRRQPGGEDQAIEAVVLDIATPQREQRLLETGAQRGGERCRRGGGFDREFMHPHRPTLDGIDTERLLGDDAQPEIFQDRQDVG